MWGFPEGSKEKNLPVNTGDPGLIPGQEDPLEEEMAIRYSVLAWEIPWTEEPSGILHGITQSRTLSN